MWQKKCERKRRDGGLSSSIRKIFSENRVALVVISGERVKITKSL
jgi:hypothetical protein